MGRLRNAITLTQAMGNGPAPERTPTLEDFRPWIRAIYSGQGNARGLGRATLLDAVHGINCMATRDPHRLVGLRDADDVCALVQYARARQTARAVGERVGI